MLLEIQGRESLKDGLGWRGKLTEEMVNDRDEAIKTECMLARQFAMASHACCGRHTYNFFPRRPMVFIALS